MSNELTVEEIQEGLSLLNGESISIEPARKKVVRHKGKMVEVEEAAYVKFSTAFKEELKGIGEHALKVFLYIGLSIGFETGSAHPGIRKIAEDTGMAQNTVLKAVQELEEKGFMTVHKKEKSSNVYTPVRYFSIGKSASPDDADETNDIPNLPQQNDNLPHENANLPQSSRVNLLNQNNKIKQELEEKMSIENLLFLGKEVKVSNQQNQALRDTAPKQFENALGFSKPLPWWKDKEWTEFAEWVCDRYSENRMCFGEYNIWRNTPFTKGGISNTRLRGFVIEFYDSWDMFVMSKKPIQEEPIRPEHVRFTGGEDVSSAVPNPYKKPAILQRKTSSDLSGSDEVV